jgi:peroxiredoxin
MANPYTGDLDVVVEFSLSAIDRFLALQHQGDGHRGFYPHSLAVIIDNDDLGVYGVATIQCSPPTITLPVNHAGSRVTVHFQVMARLTPVAERLPATVHGELQVSVPIGQEREAGDNAVTISVDFGADDLGVTFVPDAGAPLADDERDGVTALIRAFLRTGFQPVNARVTLTEIEEGFTIRHWRFKTLRAGDINAVAILLNLRDTAITDELAADVGRVFLDGQDFAVAVGGDFLVETLTDLVRGALRRAGGIPIHEEFLGFDLFEARVSPDLENIGVELRGADAEFPHGSIRLTMSFGVAGNVALVGFETRVTASQHFVLTVNQERTQISLVAAGDPELHLPDVPGPVEGVVGGFLSDKAATARDRILADMPPLVEGLPPGFSEILGGLQLAPPDVTYAQPEITSDCVFIPGRTYVKRWKPAVARFEVQRLPVIEGLDPEFGRVVLVRHELNAFESWIPGGTVHRYDWTESTEAGDRDMATEEHRFFTTIEQNVLEDLAVGRDPNRPRRVCLEVSGVQGQPPLALPEPAQVCALIAPQVPAIRGFDGGMVIDVPDVRDGVVAHMQPWVVDDLQNTIGRPRRSRRGPGMIVLFLGAQADSAWREIGEALNARKRKGSGVFVVAIAPSAATLSPLKVDANVGWARSDDPAGAWSDTFKPGQRPAVYLLNGSSKPVWQHVGAVDRAALTAALDEHLQARQPLRWRQLGVRARHGERAPDFLFEYGKGRQMALRTLRKRPAILGFWKSWSAPCLAELHRLHELRERAGSSRPAILAINDGDDPVVAQKVFGAKRLALTFVADPDRRISHAYGVRCWPTTITLDERGIVQETQLGRHADEPDDRRD